MEVDFGGLSQLIDDRRWTTGVMLAENPRRSGRVVHTELGLQDLFEWSVDAATSRSERCKGPGKIDSETHIATRP